jgi:flavin-dependent dehydrogenase
MVRRILEDGQLTEFDVVVVGGGPAGSACAAELARGGCVTALVDADSPPHGWAGESLPPGSTSLVNSVLGPLLTEEGPHTVAHGTGASWGSDEFVITDFIMNPLDDAWILDRVAFDADARSAASDNGAHLFVARAQSLIAQGNRWQVTCRSSNGTRGQMSAPILVDATGRQSFMASRLGARRRKFDRLMAMIVVSDLPGDSRAGTSIESCRSGWWYTTPLPSGGRVVAFLTDADLIPSHRERREFWRDSFEATTHIRNLVSLPDGSESLEIHTHRADTSVLVAAENENQGAGIMPPWLAVGDAAASWDPLSSQGLMTGILLGAKGARALLDGQGAVVQWREDLVLLVEEHQALQNHYYSTEDRWPNEEFWRRRRKNF